MEDFMEDHAAEQLPAEDIEGEELPAKEVTLSALDLPQIVDWEDGSEHRVLMQIVQKNKREEDGVTTADFEVLSVEPEDEMPPDLT